MCAWKYSDRIITDELPLTPQTHNLKDASLTSTHLLTVNGERLKGFFYVDCSWLWKGSGEGDLDEPHSHSFPEVLGFVGSNRDDPHDLGGEIAIQLGDEKKVLTRSCLIFIPAGFNHFPVQINRVDRPIFFVTIAQTENYTRNPGPGPVPGRSSACSIITDTKTRFTVAASGENMPPPPPRDSSLKSDRILHLEDDMASGSFYVDFVWIWEGNGGAPAPEHTHDWVELIAMVGADPENPHDLGGTMSIVLGDETHMITRSSLVCIPAGLKHCPWKFTGIKKPTLVFTAGPAGTYTGSHKREG